MRRQGKRWKTTIVASLVLMILFTSLSYAAGSKRIEKMLKAYYGTVQIIYNGENKTAQFDPFIVDGTTYVPLRTMSDIFNKNVAWDATTNTATVTDKPTESVEYWKNQIIVKDIEISNLKNKIDELEKENDDKDRGDKSLRDLEKDLQKEYGKYEGIKFDITLKGDSKDVDVRIEFDGRKYRDDWDDLSSRKITNFIEDICDDVLYEFSKADVEGYVRDTDDRKDVTTFYTKSSGKVVIDDDDRDRDRDRDISLRDLERDLYDDYYDYFNDIKLDIKLKGDSKDVKCTVDIDYYKYKKEWNKLTDKEIEKFMSKIYEDIEDEWRKADITIYVYDTDDKSYLSEYYKNSSGKTKFYRY